MSFLSLILWVLGALVALRVLAGAIVLQLYARLRFQRFRLALLEDPSRVDACLQPMFEHAARELEALGFEVAGMASMEVPFLCDEGPAPILIMREPARQVWALVLVSSTPVSGAPLNLQLWSYFEGGRRLVTLSGEAFGLIDDAPELHVVDRFRSTWDEQVRDHMAELERQPRQALAFGVEELVARANAEMEVMIARLSAVRDASGERFHQLSWQRVLLLTLQFVRHSGAVNQLHARRSRLAPWPISEAAQLSVAARAYRIISLAQTFPPRRSLVWGTFGVTAALFAGSMMVYGSFGFTAQLLLVVLVHELGHWLAMRLSGYRDPAIFFIPFFGAATAGQKADASFRQELTVLLAGPLPGLLLGAGLLLSGLDLPEWATELARAAVWVNGANLFPIWPLDGGRVVHRLLLRDRPWLEAAFSLLSAALFAMLALAASDPFLLLVPVGLVSAGISGLRVARQAQRARALAAQGLTDPLLQALRVAGEKPSTFTHKVMVVRRVLARMQAPESTRGQLVLGSLGYAAVVLMTVLALGLTARPNEREQSLECTQLTQLAALREPDSLLCHDAQATQTPRWAELSAFSELPSELCLRAPWHAGPALSEAQVRARKTVGGLLVSARSAGTVPRELNDQEEHTVRAWTRHRVERVLEQARLEPDFDASAAEALLAYLGSSDEDGPAKRALEAQLGAADCGDAPSYVGVGTMQQRHQAGVVADPAQLAAHLCAAGCRRLTLVTYE